MAVLPPAVVAGCFLVAALTALVAMAYIAWKGSKPTNFFSEAVEETYVLELPEQEINDYYDLKERFQQKVEAMDAPPENADENPLSWAHRLPQEDLASLHQALLRRLVKGIDRLDQVQRDKPGNFKLWRSKLVSEHFWETLLESERLIGEEIDSCLSEADELQPGARDHCFQHAVHLWRSEKQQDRAKKEQKKAVEHEKKQKIKEERSKVAEVKQAEEDKKKQELAAEKAMEKLLREEENESKKKGKKLSEKAKPKKK